MASTTPLWHLFNKSWEALTGTEANAFAFIPDKTPFATMNETAAMLVIYYVTIFGGRELMRGRPAFELKTPFKVHNLFLTALSGGLLALFLEQLVPTVWRRGVFDSVCDGSAGWTQPLTLLYYVSRIEKLLDGNPLANTSSSQLNYLTKYVEFIDTAFLVLKKKRLSTSAPFHRVAHSLTWITAFLHTYHHGATALLCYVQLVGETPVSWVPITLNLSVHCLMYWYYFQSARGIAIWWKKYITVMQIIQFVIDLGEHPQSLGRQSLALTINRLCLFHLVHALRQPLLRYVATTRGNLSGQRDGGHRRREHPDFVSLPLYRLLLCHVQAARRTAIGGTEDVGLEASWVQDG